MTCEGNKKGCNNKILINTLMLASMVCILSVSDMLGMDAPEGYPLNPYEAMEKINKNEEALKEFYKIFEGREDLIKRNCCCCCGRINIEKTQLPNDEKDTEKQNISLSQYIQSRFIRTKENVTQVKRDLPSDMKPCGAFDNIILGIYKESTSE